MINDIIFQPNFLRLTYRVFLWHLKYLRGRGGAPLGCGFYLTSQCNFQCEFCNIWRIKPGFQISRPKAQSLINQLGKMGLIYFSFSGGEPLLVPYVFDLLAYAKEFGIIYTHLVSNGYLMDKNKAESLAEANASEISFSLDGDEKVHDQKRGMRGAFKKVMEAVDYVKTYAPKTRIVLNAILDPIQPENAVFAVQTAKRLGVKIKVQPLNDHPAFGTPASAVKKSRPFLQPDEKKRLVEAINLIQRSPGLVNSKPFLENYKAFLFCPEKLAFSKDDCLFGYHHIEFFAGQIFPCLEGLNWREGVDISKTSIKEILTSLPYRKKVEELRGCLSCRNNYYICYYEPRLNFPVGNFIKSRLRMPQIASV